MSAEYRTPSSRRMTVLPSSIVSPLPASSALQPTNTPDPKLTTDAGMLTFSSAYIFRKALSPIAVSPSGSAISVMIRQELKASLPILKRPDGSCIAGSLMQL